MLGGSVRLVFGILLFLLAGCAQETQVQIPKKILVLSPITSSSSLDLLVDPTIELDIQDALTGAKSIQLDDLNFQSQSVWVTLHPARATCSDPASVTDFWLLESGFVRLRLNLGVPIETGTYRLCLRRDDGNEKLEPDFDYLLSEDGNEPYTEDFEVTGDEE